MNLFKCVLIHKWNKWQDCKTGKYIRERDNAVMGTFIVQERRCEDCGKLQIRTVDVTS